MNSYFILSTARPAILQAKTEEAAAMLFKINNPTAKITACMKMASK